MRVLALVLAASLAQAQSTPQCESRLLSAKGAGAVAIGMTPDSLARVCRIVGQRKAPEYDLTIIDVLVGSDTVRAFAQRGRIAWIEVTSPRLRTTDSLGVGSSAASILHLPDVTGGPGDGTDTFALSAHSGPHCGLTFWLDSGTAEMLNAARGDRLHLLGMRGGTVTRVDVRGACPGR